MTILRNLYSGSGSEVHSPHPQDATRPACGTVASGKFHSTLNAVTCRQCGITTLGLDEFAGWDNALVGQVIDNGDSVGLRVRTDASGIEVALDLRIRPEDTDRLIALLSEIRHRRDLGSTVRDPLIELLDNPPETETP